MTETVYEFDDTASMPAGRSRGELPDFVLAALARSADSGKGQVVKKGGIPEITEAQVKEWRGWLRKSEVQKRYVVTTNAERLPNGLFRFTFGAKMVPDAPHDEAPASAPKSAPRNTGKGK